MIYYVAVTLLVLYYAERMLRAEAERHKRNMRRILWQQSEEAWNQYCRYPSRQNCEQFRDMLKRYVSFVEEAEL